MIKVPEDRNTMIFMKHLKGYGLGCGWHAAWVVSQVPSTPRRGPALFLSLHLSAHTPGIVLQ